MPPAGPTEPHELFTDWHFKLVQSSPDSHFFSLGMHYKNARCAANSLP